MFEESDNGNLPNSSNPVTDETAAGNESEELSRALAELELKTMEAEQNKDLFLRERAELENFKKRMQRERREAIQYSIGPVIRELLPIIDNLERAVSHAVDTNDGESLVEGVKLVLQSAREVLQNHGVARIDAHGQPFDPNLHEAVAQVTDFEGEPNQVVEQFLPGYRLHERLLRAAQVSVSSKPPEPSVDEEQD
jgi:molecular chaperone GrpE